MAKPKIDIDKALILHKQGDSYAKIGKIYGVSASAVFQRLQPYLPDMGRVEAMRLHKGDKLLETASITLERINKIVKAGSQDEEDISYKDLIIGLGLLIDKHQLITGQATSSTKHTVKHTGKLDDNIIDIPSLDKCIDINPDCKLADE